MAHYAAVASVVQLLDDIIRNDQYLSDHLHTHSKIIDSLFHKFNFLLGLLRDYSSRSGDGTTRRIRDVADRAQKILESEVRHPVAGRANLLQWFRDPSRDLVVVGEKVDSAVKKLLDSPNKFRYDFCSSANASELRRPPVVGLRYQVNDIQADLRHSSYSLVVIPIVGMAGIGKTTLARELFHSPSPHFLFHIHIWITVSQNYNANNVLRQLLKGLGHDRLNVDHGDTVRLRKLVLDAFHSLWRSWFLIIVDDLWSKEAWDDLRQILPENGQCCIVCTTRFEDVASYVDPLSGVHRMRCLHEYDSWLLLKRMVYFEERCPPAMEVVGRDVASKCGGLPFAIVVIASILPKGEQHQQYWEYVGRILSNSAGQPPSFHMDHHGILFQALSLSYDQLTDQLKSLFLYLGKFRDDHEINIRELVKLWTVEGLVKANGEGKTSEQVAEECLQILVKRNLVIPKQPHVGCSHFKFCTLHDVVRNFCRQRACDENFFNMATDGKDHFYPWDIDTIELNKCELLKVLDVIETTPWSVLNEVQKMFHLKCLSLHVQSLGLGSELPPIPPSIFMLQNLETLIIYGPKPFPSVTLPPQIWKMTLLRHIVVTMMTLPPPNISTVSDTPTHKLESLQTLSAVKDFMWTNEAIEMIPNLRKLKISCTGIEGSGWYVFYHLCNLVHLKQLEELKVMVYTIPIFGLDFIWSSFALPLNRTKLSLGGCKLPWEEIIVVSSLPNLQILKLRKDSFVGTVWGTEFDWEFCNLKFLLLEMLDLKYWYPHKTSFPFLQHLKIKFCRYLEMIPFYIRTGQFIRLIEVYGGGMILRESTLCYKEGGSTFRFIEEKSTSCFKVKSDDDDDDFQVLLF